MQSWVITNGCNMVWVEKGVEMRIFWNMPWMYLDRRVGWYMLKMPKFLC